MNCNYKKNGYFVIQNILTKTQIINFRNYIIKKLNDYHTFYLISPENSLISKEILDIALNEALIKNIKKIFHPEFVLIPDIEVQINAYGSQGKSFFSGWHADSNSEKFNDYLQDKNYGFAKVGIYLGDNNSKFSHGIDIVPRSHQYPIMTSYNYINVRLKDIRDKFYILFKKIKIESSAGDAIIFDSRIIHRSSRKINYLNHTDLKNIKIVVYYNVAYPKNYEPFILNSRLRALNSNSNIDEQKHFSSYAFNKFPKDYSSYFIEKIKKLSILVA